MESQLGKFRNSHDFHCSVLIGRAKMELLSWGLPCLEVRTRNSKITSTKIIKITAHIHYSLCMCQDSH